LGGKKKLLRERLRKGKRRFRRLVHYLVHLKKPLRPRTCPQRSQKKKHCLYQCRKSGAEKGGGRACPIPRTRHRNYLKEEARLRRRRKVPKKKKSDRDSPEGSTDLDLRGHVRWVRTLGRKITQRGKKKNPGPCRKTGCLPAEKNRHLLAGIKGEWILLSQTPGEI